MIQLHSTSYACAFNGAFLLGAFALINNCGDYESCETTRSCPSSDIDAGTGGALGASGSRPDSSAGTAGSSGGRGGSTGSAGSTGNAGDGGGAGVAGTTGTGGSTGIPKDASDPGDAADGTSDAGGGAPDGAQPDTTKPTVVSVTPTAGAKGITKDENIVIVFSERMDPMKTQAAYSSTDLPAAGISFTWSPDGTTLTIDPRADLIYQADTVPSTAQAKSYAFSIATSAADAAGNTLAAAFTSNFTTLRRIVQKLNSQSYEIFEDATGSYVEACSFMIVGAHMGYWFGGLVEFDLSILPADVRLFEKGQLDTMQYFGTQGTADYPFGPDRLGVIVCDHTVYNPPTSAKLMGGAVRRLGTLSSGAGEGPQSLDTVNAVREDYEQRAARRNRTQYRIAFTIQNPNYQNAQNNAIFDCTPSALTLTLTYLAP